MCKMQQGGKNMILRQMDFKGLQIGLMLKFIKIEA